MDTSEFSPEDFVADLLKSADNEPCDETSSAGNKFDIPPFYNEKLYKGGQKFYHKHLFAMSISKIFGLISVLSIPRINEILVFTRMSDSDLKSYRRYAATIFHVKTWYDDEFKPGTKLWTSMKKVRKMHDRASGLCGRSKNMRITQLDMALTQCGFIGFALLARENVGIFYSMEEEWKAFIHLWRVIGYMMGIEDRFNICRESVEETIAICKLIMKKVFRQEAEKRDQNFLLMSSYLLNGLWYINFNIQEEVFMNMWYNTLTAITEGGTMKNEVEYYPLTPELKKLYKKMVHQTTLLKNTFWRWLFNILFRWSIWLTKVFPFTGFYRFGVRQSYVKI